MKPYNKVFIQNMIIRAISAGQCNDDTMERFLLMKMENDLEDMKTSAHNVSVYDLLIENGIFDEKDFIIGCNKKSIFIKKLVEGLNVTLSPTYHLLVERIKNHIEIRLNKRYHTSIYVGQFKSDEGMAMWLIRQKQNLDHYLQEWETTFLESAKKIKGNRMAFLAIKAIVTEAMKEYPEVKYEIVEQKRRARIKVKIPNTNLGVCLDGWWRSYKKNLPLQIESLKALIEFHKTNTAIKTFTIYKS